MSSAAQIAPARAAAVPIRNGGRFVSKLARERIIAAKEELMQFDGLVTEILPDARFRVQLDAGHEVIVYTAGKMKRNRIKTLTGDRVAVEMSPYDLEKGRLVFRHKGERSGPARRAPPRAQFRRR
jgi:translation initiation factor IF-1